MLKVLLDSNVFLFGYPDKNTNSRTVMDSMDGIEYYPVISYHMLEEVAKRAKVLYGREVAGLIRLNVLTLPELSIIGEDATTSTIPKYDEFVADKSDLPHICAFFLGECDIFVTSNMKLTRQRIKDQVNFMTPRDFVTSVLKKKPFDTPNGI